MCRKFNISPIPGEFSIESKSIIIKLPRLEQEGPNGSVDVGIRFVYGTYATLTAVVHLEVLLRAPTLEGVSVIRLVPFCRRVIILIVRRGSTRRTGYRTYISTESLHWVTWTFRFLLR